MILQINTKDPKVVVVGLKKNGETVRSLSEENEYGSQVLLPLIVKLVTPPMCNFSDLDGVEVEAGPGSFTGLRVGASVAQALGFVLNIPVNGRLNKPVEVRYT